MDTDTLAVFDAADTQNIAYMNNNEAPLESAAVTALLRNNVFNLKVEDLGLSREKSPLVWGVMMELGYQEVVVSLVVLADGSCSVYLTDGSGVVGCGLYSEVRQVAVNMLNVAQRVMTQCLPAFVHPLPTDSRVRFYLLTGQGVLTTETSRHEMDEGAAEIAELYYAGHGVIGMIELLGAGVDIVDEMRMAQSELNQANDQSDDPPNDNNSDIQAMATLRSRGRTCRILPSAGSAARRWHN